MSFEDAELVLEECPCGGGDPDCPLGCDENGYRPHVHLGMEEDGSPVQEDVFA